MTAAPAPNFTPRADRDYLWRIVFGASVMYVVLQGGLTLLTPRFDQTVAAIVVAAAMIAVAFLIERWAFGRDIRHAFKALGLSRPLGRAVAVSLAITAAMAAFFPVYSLVTGVPVELRTDWRGAARGHRTQRHCRGDAVPRLRLRAPATGRPVVLACRVHLTPDLRAGAPRSVRHESTPRRNACADRGRRCGLPVGVPVSRAGNTIWAGVVLHVGAHSFRLVDIPERNT